MNPSNLPLFGIPSERGVALADRAGTSGIKASTTSSRSTSPHSLSSRSCACSDCFLRNLFACFDCDCNWPDFTQTSSGQQSLVLRTTVGPAPVDGTAIPIAGSLSSNKQGPHGMRACCAGAGANGGGGCSLLLVHSLALDGGGGGEF